MLPLFILIIITVVHLKVECYSQCPAVFRRLSENHSFCRSRNPECSIFSSGLMSGNEKEIILREHNKYRSRCALGNEAGAGGLPRAADMMEMVWDEELAAIAQKWAEQCNFNHDCNTCRAVNSYQVGQNLGYKQWSCLKKDCRAADKLHPRDWAAIIEMFHNEINVFNKNLVTSMQFDDGEAYGHLTQILWAKTWRIGCGYVSHLYRNKYRQLYVCNYGPGGNIISKPMYSIGKPCSQCPFNTCCGESCSGGNIYPGLCRMLDDKGAPIYQDARRNTAIFYSDFGKNSPSDLSITGINKWRIRTTNSGNILSIVLNGGEKSTVHFSKAIQPSEAFCMTLRYKKGPNEAGQKNSNKLELLFEPERLLPITVHINPSSSDFFTYNLDLDWTAKTKFSLQFSVPPSAPPQYLNVQSIVVSNGQCDNRR